MAEGMLLAERTADEGAPEPGCGSFARHAEDVVRQGRDGAAAWRGHRLATHFQPIFSVRQGACHGHEALLRAERGPDGAPVPPQQLFDGTEREDRIRLDWLCRALHLRNFARIDRGERSLFLNVFPEAALSDARCVTEFADLVRYYGLSPRRVCVEILETECADEGLLREAVAAYRDVGVTIAMDDFGVGRSNFDRIVSLRPDIVKIDRSVLVDAVGDAKARAALPGIVRLLHDAGAQVAAEGIESAVEALVAVDAGADFLQGSYFARPRADLLDEAFSERILGELLRVRESKARLRAVG
jgi:EAL domain-containing protein (putative c-di-GMP-specific phosphodiesterase class I)